MYASLPQPFQPLTVLSLALAVVLVCLWRRRRETPRVLWLLTVPVAVLLVSSIPAVNYPLLGSLEWGYPPRNERPAKAEAIVVLDGGVSFPDATRPEAELGPDSMRRCAHAAALYHQGRPCPVVVTGGYRDPHGSGRTISQVMGDFLTRLGVKPDNLILEDRSRSTYQSAVECRRLLDERGIRRVVLVTDAFHLRRAVGCFRKQGVEVFPSGSWYQATEFRWEAGTFLPNLGGAQAFQSVLGEWAGLAWYRLLGRV
jgi:uncharacterized SAM-binding protein YcdF (DUF218 family)